MASIDDDYQETVVSDVHEASLNPISRFSIFEPKEVDGCSEQHRKENIVSVDSEGDLTLPRRRRIPCKAFLETFILCSDFNVKWSRLQSDMNLALQFLV